MSFLSVSVFFFCSDFEHVKAPVSDVEEEEGDGEDEPGVLVDDVDVFDLRNDGLHGRRSPFELIDESALAVFVLAAHRAVTTALPRLPAARLAE